MRRSTTLCLLAALALLLGCRSETKNDGGAGDDDIYEDPECSQVIDGHLRIAPELLPSLVPGTGMVLMVWESTGVGPAGIPTGEGDIIENVNWGPDEWELPESYDACGKPGGTTLVAFIDEGDGEYCTVGDLHAFLVVGSEDAEVEDADLTFDGVIDEDCERPPEDDDDDE